MAALWQRIAEKLKLARLDKHWHTFARALAVIVVFCTTYMLILPAITMEQETYCGITDHTHTEECYLKLRPEMGPDGETYTVWEATLAETDITDNSAENILGIALSQLGYAESTLNVSTDAGGAVNGYTRYGQWYGNPYGEWSELFVSFCLYYARLENAGSLMGPDAAGMKYAWEKAGLFVADEHIPSLGELVFVDADADGEADKTGIVSEVSEGILRAVFGDVEGSVEEVAVADIGAVAGYGLSGGLAVKEYLLSKPVLHNAAPDAGSNTEAVINHTSDLHDHIIAVDISDKSGVHIDNNSTVYIGEVYNVSLEFSEDNEGNVWTQFEYNSDGYLTYMIPDGLKCKPFAEWHPITAKTSTGTIENVGEYFVDETGLLRVRFFEVDDGHGGTLNFIDKYSNAAFFIDFEATVASMNSGSDTVINFGQEIEVNLTIDGSAAMDVTKTHGRYNQVDNTMEYVITVNATRGVVRNLVIDDQIWDTHIADRSTITVTDLHGNPIEPQPVVSNHPAHYSGADEGFSISGFPDLPAGEGFIITYKTNIYENILENNTGESIGLWNGIDVNAKDGNGDNMYKWAEDWIGVKLHNLKKEGQMKKIEDEDGNEINVLEWVVREGDGNTYIESGIIIDTLGKGIYYYTGEPISVRVLNQDGSYTVHYIDWADVMVTDSSIRFDLPPGYEYKIVYYTTYDPLADGEDEKVYHNIVKSVIHDNESEVEGSGVIVGFEPEVHKSASGEDGEYVYYTITAEVPGSIAYDGNFHFTDTIAFWNYPEANVHTYVENKPEDIVVQAKTADGTVITFTPYTEGGATENTYILLSPSPEGNNEKYHSFDMLFNTSSTVFADSMWILDEPSTLTVSYKIPFDAKTDTAWYSPPSGNKTLGDILYEDRSVSNEVYFNFTEQAYADCSVVYSYNPKIEKFAEVHPEGYIDYTVIYHNTVPGSGGDEGYLDAAINNIVFTDTFDEKLSYVEGSLTVTAYDPWRDLWLCKYIYDGAANGNTLSVNASEMKFLAYNYEGAQYDEYGNSLWGTFLANCKTFAEYISVLDKGGDHVYTYRLKVRDEYKYTTEYATLIMDNTAEVTWGDTGSSGPVSVSSEFHTGLVDKHVVQDESMLDFSVYINRNALDILAGMDTLTIEDRMSENLSLYWDSIKLFYQDANGDWVSFNDSASQYECTVRYDQENNMLTFIVPDSLPIKIDYTTLITKSGTVSVKNAVAVVGKAYVSDIINAQFHVEEHSGGASGSAHDITLLKQDGMTGTPLPGASFLLYGPVGAVTKPVPEGYSREIILEDGTRVYYIGYYSTGVDGTIKITSQYLNYGGPYMFVEDIAPEGYEILAEPVTFYYYNDAPNERIPTVTTLIAIENYKGGYILPETGGIGVLPIYITGGLLISLSTVFLLCYIKKDKERRRKYSES